MRPSEEIAIYKKLVSDLREVADEHKKIIDRLVTKAEAKINAPPVYKCNYCCDTGCEDVRGDSRCRNGCPKR